jgi:hypothetical protein
VTSAARQKGFSRCCVMSGPTIRGHRRRVSRVARSSCAPTGRLAPRMRRGDHLRPRNDPRPRRPQPNQRHGTRPLRRLHIQRHRQRRRSPLGGAIGGRRNGSLRLLRKSNRQRHPADERALLAHRRARGYRRARLGHHGILNEHHARVAL